jgi:serine/threonine protein kinase
LYAQKKLTVLPLSQLDHPNMIRFLGGNGEPPNAYLVTELVENGSLWELLHDRKKIIPWTMRMRIAYGTPQPPRPCVRSPRECHPANARCWLSRLAWPIANAEIADGMAYLHDKSVLHRDLKSENILARTLHTRKRRQQAHTANVPFFSSLRAQQQIAGDLRRPERTSPMVKIADLGMSRWMRAKGNKSVLTMGRGTSQWSTSRPPPPQN